MNVDLSPSSLLLNRVIKTELQLEQRNVIDSTCFGVRMYGVLMTVG